MKKFYLAVVCFFSCTVMAFSQTDLYWVGPLNGNWNSTANWSATSGGSGGAGIPNTTSYNAVFTTNATVNVDLATFSINRLFVTSSSAVKLYTGSAPSTTITLTSTSLVSRALEISTGSSLTDSASVINTIFLVSFANDAKGLINGTWAFSGVVGLNTPVDDGFAYFSLPPTTGLANNIQINGTIQLNNYSAPPDVPYNSGYLNFNSGSNYWLNCDGAAAPNANWNVSSNIQVTGVQTNAPSLDNIGQPGNLLYNSAGMTANAGWNWPANLIIGGNFSVLSTNNKVLSLSINNGSDVNYTINGNVNVSGNSALTFVQANQDVNYTLQVNGNFNLSGGVFSLRDGPLPAVLTGTSALKVKGNINHTGGTFTSNHIAVSTTSELYVVEMNGTAAQTITSTGSFNNAANQVTLRLNNASGTTLLSPLTVGKLSWNSANKGNLITSGSNYVTINNPSTTDNTVVYGVSGTGFVSGPVARATNTTVAYRFPTGKSGAYRYAEVIPAAATASVYVSEYFGTAYSDLTTNGTVDGVSNVQYWSINRISGADAAIQLTLQDGAVPGANPGSLITVAQYAPIAHWKNANQGSGTTLPYNATTGSVRSAVLSSFITPNFTFGYGNNAALPIELVDFAVKKQSGATALVNWKVSDNSTPVKFGVLRSVDGVNFTGIGTVAAGENVTDYNFTDNALPTGTIYYRLQMYDKDGSYKLSKIIAVMNGVKGILITGMMPTIVHDRARLNVVSSEKGTIQLVVTDIQGRIVYQQLAGINNGGSQDIWMSLSALGAGNYQVTGYMNNESVGTFRFIKQ